MNVTHARHAMRRSLALACLLPGSALVAQRAPALTGVSLGGTLSDPTHTGAKASYFADADLGWVGAPNFRVLLGAYGFASERAADADAGAVRGSITGLGARARMRFALLDPGRVAWHVTSGATLIDFRTRAPAATAHWPQAGVRLGASVGAGAGMSIDRAGRMTLVSDLDRVFVGDLTHWSLALGVRYMTRGRAAEELPRVVRHVEDPAVRLERERRCMTEWVQRAHDELRADSVVASKEWARRRAQCLEAR